MINYFRMANNWGGARQGAGRKDLGDKKRVPFACRLPADVKEKLYEEAERENVSTGELIERLMKIKRSAE